MVFKMGRGGCRPEEGKGKAGRFRKERNYEEGPDKGGFGPARFPGDQWEGSGSDTAREAGVLPSAGFISAFRIPGKPGCSNMGEESLREQKRSGRAWWRVAGQLEVT